MEGFTGLDPATCKSNIEEFKTAGLAVYNAVKNANTTLINGLTKVWFSEFAVAFGTNHTRDFYDSQELIRTTIIDTIAKCVNAYNAIASSVGEPTIDGEYETENLTNLAPNDTNDQFDDFKNYGDDGHTAGMDIDAVRELKDEYNNTIYQIVDIDIDAIPMNIAFYDPAGELMLAYKNDIQTIKTKLEENITTLEMGINAEIENEATGVEEGAQNAAEALNGTGTKA